MATRLMRLIDYWLGVPLCFLLGIINYLSGFIPCKKRRHLPPKILLIKLSEMGGIILSYSLIARLKKEYPGSEIFFLTFKKNRPLVEILNVLTPENILTITEDSAFGLLADTFKVIDRLQKERIDIALDLELFSRFTAILTYLSGAAKRIGYYRYYFEGLYRGNLLTHNIQYNPLLHTAKALLSLAQTVKLDRKTTPELAEKIEDREIIIPKFVSPREDLEQLWRTLEGLGVARGAGLFLVNPGEGIIPAREWPMQHFISLAQKILAQDHRNYIVIIGTGGVSKKAEQMHGLLNNARCLDLTNKTTFRQLLSLMTIGTALIANDCGLAHIASLTALRTFVIFGPESPALYAPLGENTHILYANLACSPCLSALNHRNSTCRDNKCLQLIKPEEVFDLITRNTR